MFSSRRIFHLIYLSLSVAQREDRVKPTATASSEQHKRTLLIYYYYHYLIVDKYNLEEFKNYKILSWI